MSESGTITMHGMEVTVEHVGPRPEGGARVDIEADDGRRWRLDITRSGSTELVTSWRGDQLADLEVPEWMDDIVARVGRAA